MKLHLGCGCRNFGLDWTHIDGGDFPHLYSHSVTKLPFTDNSIDLIYASHLLSYFDREEALLVLQEWKRVLEPGGILRLAVTDFEAVSYLYHMNQYPLKNFLGPLFGKWKIGDKNVYHKTIYDYPELEQILYSIGMKNIRRWDWRQVDHGKFDDHSQCYLPHMDKENGTCLSLNVEAVK